MMRRNNRRREFNIQRERENNKTVTIALSVLVIAILSFTITFVIYRNYLNKQAEIAEIQRIADLGKENKVTSSEASSSIGKSVNEIEEENSNKTTNETKKIAINVSNMKKENEVNEDVEIETSQIANEEEEEQEQEKEQKTEEVKLPDPTFKMPVQGEITNTFAKDTLIYSNTLQEWVTHTGVDIKADKTTLVKAASQGTVKSIKNDPRFGITVVIEHANGFESVYSNLLTAEFVNEGENVEQGQSIGTVGNTATFEIADPPHLHFEILKDNEHLNPELYLK